MADDNSARYRPSGQPGHAPGSDPLAELARLIGQNDAFSDYGRDNRQPPAAPQGSHAADPMPSFLSAPPQQHYDPAPQQSYAPDYGEPPSQQYADDPNQAYGENYGQQYAQQPAQDYRQEPAPRYQEPAPRYAEPTPRYQEPAPQPQHYGQPAPHQLIPQQYARDTTTRYESDFAAHNDWPGQPPPAPAPSPYPVQQQAVNPRGYEAQGYPNPVHQNPPHPGPSYPAPSHSMGAPAFGSPTTGAPNFGNPNFGNPPIGQGMGMPPAGQGYGDSFPRPGDPRSHHPQGYDAAGYQGGPPYGDPAGMQPQDDEYYEDEPRGRRKGLLTVVAVLALAIVGTAGAFGYRSFFGGPGMSGPPPLIRASSEPTKVAPPPSAPDPSASKFSYDRFSDAGKDEKVVRREEKPVDLATITPPPAPKNAAGNAPSAIGEPRKVRTVPIRPDQPDTTTSPIPLQPQATSQVPMSAPPQRQASNLSEAAPAKASPRAALRSPPAAAAASANAPLSLSPDANNAAVSSPVQDSTPPAPPSQRAAPAPAKLASAPATGGGSFLVQVSSQRSEADAESAYRGIQSKYSSVLSSQPHQVRKADLGTKGVYYRAMVGPFGSREAALQVCASLKQAGGDCVVQH